MYICKYAPGVIYRGDNLSGHSAIYVKLKVEQLPRLTIPPHQYHPKQCCKKVTVNDIHHYKYRLEEQLEDIIPHSISACTDIHCNSLAHRQSNDQYIVNIIKFLEGQANGNR